MNYDQAVAYRKGEKAGRRDRARAWGMADTSQMSEYEAMGYRDGWHATGY
jgi:hypothetical protein